MRPETIALLIAVATGVQAVIRFGFGRRIPIGDENEYLARAQAEDPFEPSPFLRVPAMAMLTRLAGRRHRLRDALALVSLLTSASVAAAGYVMGGPGGAVAAMLIFSLLPDRIVLSQHIWPDMLLAFWHSIILFFVAWSLEVAPVSPWIFGALAAAAAMTRIDGAILAPALTIVALLHGEDFTRALPGLWMPTLVAIAAITLRNARRYGIALPDTTILFNVSILAEDHTRRHRGPAPVQTLTRAIWGQWKDATHRDRTAASRGALAEIARQPGRLSMGILERFWQMLGPDTFGIQILLDPVAGAYPGMSPILRTILVRGLRIGFPLLTACALAGAVANPSVRVCLLPGCASFLVACLFQARTRFRYAILPALSFAGGAGILAMVNPASRWQAVLTVGAAAGILLCAPGRREYDPDRATS